MDRALELAREAAARGEVPVGCVIALGGEIVGEGANAREAGSDPTAHAEIVAIRAAARALSTWRLADCVLVATCEPCPMCAGAIVQARIRWWSTGATIPRAAA
jgi:tRNA(adenine34) deaminase